MKFFLVFLFACVIAGLVALISYGMGLSSIWPGTLVAFAWTIGNQVALLAHLDDLKVK